MNTAVKGSRKVSNTSKLRSTTMVQTAPAYNRSDASSRQNKIPDRRRHQRVWINLLGRFMRQNRQEYPCKLLNISPGGAAMLAPIDAEKGEQIIAYIDNIGRIEGKVVRSFQNGFAITIDATTHKKEKLAEQLTWLVNKKKLDLPEERRHDRIIPRNPTAAIQIVETGESLQCRVLDVSLSGASLAMEDKLPLGVQVYLGKLRGRVVRHHGQGVGVEFLDIQNPTALRSYFGT